MRPSHLRQSQKEKENQLKRLQQRMDSWKTKRKAFDRAINDYNTEPMENILKDFPATPLLKPRVFENDYRQAGDHYETDLYEAPSSETQSSSDYGQVAKQLVTSHTRPKANEIKFASGVVQDEKGGGKVWSGKTVCLKRSVSTNDLQTQILRVTMNTGVQYDQEDHKLVFADISELRRNDQMISTSDVQAQILKVTRNATSQVGVRVTPKAIDLSRVDIENLGLEVQNSKETEELGFRVGEVLCPVSVGTSVDLYEGPGVQVLGINDVDSLNLELRNVMAHATKDSHRRLKVRDIQSQIVTRESGESARSEAQESSEIQTHIGIVNKTAGIQAVAKMEVVNIPSHKRKTKVSDGTSTTFCLLPDKESTGTMSSKAATSDVITQISCILHSRGIHSDLQTYLSEYKKRSNLSETSDLGAPMQNIGLEWTRQPIPESRYSTATYDVETLISRVVRDYGTQVSSRLIPTEVTVTKINAKNMDVSFSNPLKEFDIGVPVDSFICPADMKFQTELYEGSELSIADYSGVSNLIVTHGNEVAIGSFHLGEVQVDSVDMQKHFDRGLKTQAAVVLRAKDPKTKIRIGEVTAQSGVAPKVHFVVSEIAGRPFRESKTAQSDLQTQISDSTRSLENRGRSVEFFETETDFSRRNDNILQEYSTPRNGLEIGQESFSVVREVICAKCQKKSREIQSGYDETDSKQNSVQTQISHIVASKGIQPQSNEMGSPEYSSHGQRTDSGIQVGLELVPTQISMNRHDIENMEMEFLDATEHESYNVKLKSVSCPAKIKVEARLTEGSGVHISGIEKASRVEISVSSSMPSKLADGAANIEKKSPDILCEELQTEVNFEYASASMPEGKHRSSKSTQKKLVRLIPCGVAGREMKTSGNISQVLSVTSDSSMQVGSRLVPLAIGVSPVRLENMEISLTNLGKSMSEQTSSVSAVLYPAQVELQSNLIDGQSGIELVPIEQLEVIHMNSSKSEAMVQYSSSSSDVLTQIITNERPNLLPATIVMETGQFDGHNRTPNIASHSLVCDLFKNRMRNQTISIRAKPATSEYSSGKPSSCFGYVSNEANTQTADTSIENIGEEFYIAADKPSQRVKQHAIGVQVGTKLIPQVLKLSQIPVKNMKLESSFSSSGQRESLSLQSVRCPAEVAMKSELCDDSGIVICSLDQSGEIEVEMACDSPEPRIGTKEQSFSKRNRVDGWWSGVVSGKTPLSESRSLENATIKKSAEGTITTAPIMVENSMFLQAEAILQPETSVHNPNPRYKLVMVDSSIQSTSRSLRSSVSPDRQYSSVSAAKPNWSDRSVQVGVKLIPNSIEVRPLKLENMEAVLTSKTTRVAREVDVSAILCTSGVQYEEELTETTGVQVVQINESAELSLDYCGDKFATSVTSNKKRGSVIASTDRSKQFGVGIIKARTEEPNTTPDADDGDFITTLRVKEAQYTTKNNLTGGYWEGTRTSSEEIAFVQRQTFLVDKDVQVGLNLIPKTVTVDKVSVENMEVINEQRKHGIFEQVSVGAMLCTRPTQYDQILTESKGVHVLPIRDAHDVQVGYDGNMFYTTVDSRRDLIGANYSGSRNDLPRLRVHHLEFSAEAGCIESIGKSRESSKTDIGTQVGAILIPTELKLQQMSLDANQVPRLVESISAKNILCPTDIATSSILSECSGVQIASVRGTSEISLRLGQAEYNAEVQRDTQSNETRIAIRERSISATRSFASGYVSLIEPSSSIGYIQQTQPVSGITSSTLRTMSSKSVQVGTILIPTAVTMSKVMVDNLEVSVPLNQSRSAEISVSAVLASSATEMTSVLTNTPGIHVIPMSKVDEIGIQVNGKNYIGMVEGSCASLTTGAYQSTGDRPLSSISMSQDQQKIVLPIASLTTGGSANTQSSLLRQSADLSLVRDALRSGQVTPDLREVNTISTGSFRRPGIIHIPGQTLTPITEISSTSSHTANKDAMDSSVQVGVRLIPHTVSVQRISKESIANVPGNLSKEEIDIHKVLYSSEFQYEQILQESVGVDVVPIKYAENVNVTLGGERIITSVGSIRSDRQNLISDQSRGLLDRAISPPTVETTPTLSESLSHGPVYIGGSVSHEIVPSRSSVMMCNQGTQVGIILYPQQISLERMNLETGGVNSMARLIEGRTQSVLYPTNMGVDVALCEAPGLQMADFGGNVSVDFGDSLYNANVTRTASTADASVHLINKSISPGRKSSTLEISLSRQLSKASVTSSSADIVRKYTVSTATQVGTLLVPTKVGMHKIDVENLAVEIPLTEWKSTDMNVSAILASTGTEMIPVLSEDTGIQVVDLKDLEELGIQYGDDVYVASVVGSKPKYITGTYGPARDNCVASSSSNKRREVVFISVPKNLGNAQMNQKAANLLSQSADLREIYSSLSSSVAEPRLRMESAVATPIRFESGAIASRQTSVYTGESRRQITSTEISNQPPTTSLYSFDHSGIRCNCGRHLEAVNANSRPVEITCSACGGRNVEVVGKLRGKEIFTCDCGKQYASGDISKLPITLSCSLCGSRGTVVINSISSPSQVYESYHVTCEAAIKPDMVSKRLTVNIRPIGIDADCQVNTYEQDYSVGTRLPRNQFSYMTTDDMASELMETPNLIRRAHSKKRTHSEESHEGHRTGNVCSTCRNRMMITAINLADPDDPNSYEASIRIRRVSNADTFDNSISTNLSRGSTLRRSFFTRGSDKRSSGSFESLRSQSVASKCAICHNEMTSGDLSSSIRTSTSSLIGTAAATDTRVKEIADAYARICRGADQSDGEQANLYHLLSNNRIVQAIIDDYEKEKHGEEGRYFVEAKEIAKVVSTTEKVIGNVTNEDKTTYSQLRHNSLAQKVISSYESYKHSMRVDEFIQTTSIPAGGEVASTSGNVREIIDTVNAFEKAGQVGAGRTLYTELKGNPIIQRIIKEYEVDRFARASIQRSSTSSHLVDAFSTGDSKIGILSVDGQMAKMESEQFATSDLMTRGSASISRRHKGNESREKPLSSSVSSVSGDEDIWGKTEQIALTSVRYDVAVSALITPETWDKKVQFDSSNPR